MAKYLAVSSGALTEVQPVNSSAGAGDAGKIAQLDSAGRWDVSMMPVGVTADVATVLASEALAAGDFVNIYNNAGTPNARKADASNGRQAHGFVLAAVSAAANASVYFDSRNTGVTGKTPGAVQYLSGSSAGQTTETAPTTAGQIVQRLGNAITATSINVDIQQPITLV